MILKEWASRFFGSLTGRLEFAENEAERGCRRNVVF
jgi:hypothetical protein